MAATDPLAGQDITVLRTRDACVRALRDPALGSNPGGPAAESGNLLFSDGPEHARVRAVVREVIARIEPLPGEVRRAIEDAVGALSGEFDLVDDFARPVASLVTTAMLGAGPLDARFLRDLEATTANLDVWFGGSGAARGAETAALRVAMFFLRAEAVPGGGLELLRAARDAGRLTDDELTLTPGVLAHAAYENSRNFLAVAGLRMAGEPDLVAALRAGGAAVVRRLAGEICPTRVVLRRALEPVTLPDVAIEAGAKVAVPLGPVAEVPGSAGAAFGLGRHACPGSGVAIAEAEVALRALAQVFADGATPGPPQWRPHPAFHGLTHAPVTTPLV
ncbi:cytochrome P450 [Amycolatopsis anabasis]|uniref:cytochrome P450 n=1 Tax=Amycolatopsis anabasis TaxID=1840409 RepID=UPI00131B73BF|nr:cytochrome P450 [Amycolatopsis anabasis]